MVGPGITWLSMWQNYVNQLCAVGSPWGTLGLPQGANATGKMQVLAFAANANGTVGITVATSTLSPSAVLQSGDVVRLSHCNTRGYDGTYSVTATGGITGALTYTLNSFINPKFVLPTAGRVERVKFANGQRAVDFYSFSGSNTQTPKIQKRNVGRAAQTVTFRHRKARPI